MKRLVNDRNDQIMIRNGFTIASATIPEGITYMPSSKKYGESRTSRNKITKTFHCIFIVLSWTTRSQRTDLVRTSDVLRLLSEGLIAIDSAWLLSSIRLYLNESDSSRCYNGP